MKQSKENLIKCNCDEMRRQILNTVKWSENDIDEWINEFEFDEKMHKILKNYKTLHALKSKYE